MRARAVPLVLAIGAAGLLLSGLLEPVERSLDELRFRLVRRPASGDVVVVAIDPRSLERLDVWPWPRGYHATVLERLLESGARRVAFDLDFSSRSDEDEDAAFAGVLEQAGPRAVLPTFRQWRPPQQGGGTVQTAPIPLLGEHVTLASINIRPDPDGVVRRYWTSDGDPDAAPSLAAALQDSPVSAASPFYLDFGIDPSSIPRIPYVDVLTGRFDRSLVRGRAVIVGATAVELGDQLAVPRHANLAGPMVQAIAHESLRGGRALHRVRGAALVLLALSPLVGQRLLRTRWRGGVALLAGCLAALFGISLALEAGSPLLLEIVPTGIVLIGSFAVGLVRRIDQQSLRLLLEGDRARRSESMMRHVVENSLEAIITVDECERILTFNPAAERMFGWRGGDVMDRRLDELLDGGLGSGAECRESTGRRRDGSTFVGEITRTEFQLDGRRRRVAFVRDITTRNAQERALRHQATHDALTDLPNRVMLQERMERALASGRQDRRPVATLILDLDRFKEVNDTLGHQMGDDLLRWIADRLRRPLRPTDTIARVGGDEFAILLPGSGRPEAEIVAGRLARALAQPFEVRGLSLQVDTSIGIAMFPEHGDDAATLIQRADVAMYGAKRRRQPFAFYNPEEDFNSVRHLTLRGELRRAVDEDHLVLFFQPMVCTRTGRVAGAEALLRWRHPQHGLLPPDEFVPLAEHTGLIKPIVGWVLRSALQQCAVWEAAGHPLPISVNCSAHNLLQEDLPEMISRALASCGLPADRLTLEITETVLIEDPERALDVATQLARLGVRISIDDFGTGYSSLDYLRKLPAREIKIDRSFVTGMEDDAGAAVIVRSTVDLAHNLGLEAVAEGVETAGVWRRLQDLGCDMAQGYFFGRPTPSTGFLDLLRSRTTPADADVERASTPDAQRAFVAASRRSG